MIDANVFARYMTAIADRLKFPLADGTNALYYVTLSKSLTTEEFTAAAERVFAEYDQFGFPPASVFLAYARGTPVFDTDALLREIMRHGYYLPTRGDMPPLVGTVRDAMGDVVADAYATVGSARLFSDDETTRSIARRDFTNALTEYAAMPPGDRKSVV